MSSQISAPDPHVLVPVLLHTVFKLLHLILLSMSFQVRAADPPRPCPCPVTQSFSNVTAGASTSGLLLRILPSLSQSCNIIALLQLILLSASAAPTLPASSLAVRPAAADTVTKRARGGRPKPILIQGGGGLPGTTSAAATAAPAAETEGR
jgi:hypothetical protein